MPPFNPKYVLGREGRKTNFDRPALFRACMDEGVEYYEENLRSKLCMESNIVTDRILDEQISLAITEGLILQSVSPLNGKKVYMLRSAVKPVQQSLNFETDDVPF